jgi:hypothetical protein
LILLRLPVVGFGFLIRSKIFIFILIYNDAYNFVVGRNKVDVFNRRREVVVVDVSGSDVVRVVKLVVGVDPFVTNEKVSKKFF